MTPKNSPIGIAPVYEVFSRTLPYDDCKLTFSAPGAEGQVVVSAAFALSYDREGNGLRDNDPAGRATFGIYKSRPGFICRRETYP